MVCSFVFFFFFQAEDGIRDLYVTGVQTCALPISIQEFKVQNSLYDAQYGRGGGANVNVETRSRTAQFHGNAYYFGRNEALDANNFFANVTGVPRGEFRRSQPGGTLGGPVPWSRHRAFFFVSFQATRDANAASLSTSVRSLSLPPIPQV